jgi:hypothetical protein
MQFAETGEGEVEAAEGAAVRLLAPPYVVRVIVDSRNRVLVVLWLWRR